MRRVVICINSSAALFAEARPFAVAAAANKLHPRLKIREGQKAMNIVVYEEKKGSQSTVPLLYCSSAFDLPRVRSRSLTDDPLSPVTAVRLKRPGRRLF